MYTPSLVPETASALHASPALTPMAFVQAVVWAYAKRDLDPIAALQAAQIAPEQVAKTRARITALQMELLCAHAMRELDDEALGWFGRRLPWGSYGMLARASISSPTLGLAMARWCRHHGLLNDDVTLELVRHGELAELRLQERRDLGPVREFCTVSLLRNAHGVASWLIDARLPLLEASFPFAAPPHADAYPLMFPGPACALKPACWTCRWPVTKPRYSRCCNAPCPSRYCPTAARSSGAPACASCWWPTPSCCTPPTPWPAPCWCHRAACTASCKPKARPCRP